MTYVEADLLHFMQRAVTEAAKVPRYVNPEVPPYVKMPYSVLFPIEQASILMMLDNVRFEIVEGKLSPLTEEAETWLATYEELVLERELSDTKRRVLKITWSKEAEADVRSFHGVDD